MKRAILLTRTKPLTEISYCGAREGLGVKRYLRRIFWRAHRRDAAKLIAEDMSNDYVPDTFEAWRQDEHNIRIINDLILRDERLRNRAVAIRRQIDNLEDELFDIGERREMLFDEIYDLNPSFAYG